MSDGYKENIGNTDPAPVGAEALTGGIADEREFTKRVLDINKLVDGLGEKAIALGCNRSEYDSVLKTSRNIAVMAQRKKVDFPVFRELLPRLKEAQGNIGQETLESVTKYFKDVLEKAESFKQKVAAENGAGYLSEFDDKPGFVRRDLGEVFDAMHKGLSEIRKIKAHPLNPLKQYEKRGRVALGDNNYETGRMPQFEYVLQVLTQLDNDILASLESGEDSENASKLMLQKAFEQSHLMFNDFSGQCIGSLKIEGDYDFMGETEIEKLMTALNMTERVLFCSLKAKEALRWFE